MDRNETRRSSTLWMGDLEPYMDDNFLVHAFREALERGDNIVREIKTPLNKVTGLPMGYCFVEFIDQNIAFTALHRLGGKPIPNSNPPKRFKLNTVGSPAERSAEYSVWVGDLDVMVDDEALYNHFAAKYSSTTAAKVVTDKTTGLSRGFAFVRFSDETEQQKSMIELNNTELKGRRIKIRSAKPHVNYSQHNSGFTAPPQQPPPQQQLQQQATYDMSYQNAYSQGQWYNSPTKRQGMEGAYGEYEEDPDAPVEPILIDEVSEINKEFVNMSGDVYEALESCRWYGPFHPADSIPYAY